MRAAYVPEVPDLLKQLRELTDLNTKELADYLGVSRQTIYAWEGGSRIKPGNLAAIQRSLESAYRDHAETGLYGTY